MLSRIVGMILLSLAVLLEGCATGTLHESGASDLSGPSRDAFQEVQRASGLEEVARHPVGAALYPAQARQLRALLARTPVTRENFAPRRALAWLLNEVLAGGERVEPADVSWRAERFGALVLVRPDGYLVTALRGTPLQHLGPLQFVRGHWKVGDLEVGVFYFSNAGVFYPVTGALRRAGGPPLGELGLGRDPLNAALDGSQEAMEEMVLALAGSIRHPIRALEDLTQLPTSVARLIASSPEYFARYGSMSLEDQIREAARLSTHVLMMLGGAAEATAGGMSGLGAELPMLSLSAEGELMVEGALVAGGTVTTTVGVELSALSTLHMASSGQDNTGGGGDPPGSSTPATAEKEPGRWIYKTPTNPSKDAREYQEQVTGRPAWWVYVVEMLEFDGFKAGALVEAKGPGYCSFFNADGTPKYWYKNSGKFDEMMEQARRQSELAQGLGIPLIWHVADAKVAEFLGKSFKKQGWTRTTVQHTPPIR